MTASRKSRLGEQETLDGSPNGMLYMAHVPYDGNDQPELLCAESEERPVFALVPRPYPLAFKRYEVHSKSVLVRRVPWADMCHGGSLVEQLCLLDRRAQALEWSKVRGRLAVFVRAIEVRGEPPEGASSMWMQVPQDIFDVIHDDFLPIVVDIGARFRRGEAANLIFLAQLTPVS